MSQGMKSLDWSGSLTPSLGLLHSFLHLLVHSLFYWAAIYRGPTICQGLPRWWLNSKESACQCRRHRFDPLDWDYPLEKKMETHSSNIAWEIPWAKEPGGLQSKGSESDKAE